MSSKGSISTVKANVSYRFVVAEDTSGFLGGDFGHYRHVVEQCGDIVEQGKKAGAGHGVGQRIGWRIFA